jgi:Cyclic nucleotide-binding domain
VVVQTINLGCSPSAISSDGTHVWVSTSCTPPHGSGGLEEATTVAVILDGNFEARVGGQVVGRVGPGTVVGERASLEGGRRTADLQALTVCRVAEVPAERFSGDALGELTLGHHREDKG